MKKKFALGTKEKTDTRSSLFGGGYVSANSPWSL